ncbi:MAG: heavy metal translocating P-type ATPase, partial [Acidimicrobiia bacterium]
MDYGVAVDRRAIVTTATHNHGGGTTATIGCSCCRLCHLEDDPAVDHGDHDGHRRGTLVEPGVAPETVEAVRGDHAEHEVDKHAGHGPDHTGHEDMFRKRFWISLALSVPVLIWSEAVQRWLNYEAPTFPGSFLIVPVIATVVFVYGGFPFLYMATFEIKKRLPAMMTLIALAISVAYGFSMLTLFVDIGEDFFWELVTLIDIMLLGHWMEMRAVRQASGALGALAKLMPDTADVEGP